VIFDNSEHFTECEEQHVESNNGDVRRRPQMPERKNFFSALNENFVRPFFVRKFTQQVLLLINTYLCLSLRFYDTKFPHFSNFLFFITIIINNLFFQEKLENNKKLRHIAFEAMKHDCGPSSAGPHGATGGGRGSSGCGDGQTSGPNESSSSDEEVYFQSSSTLNAPANEPAFPLLPL
jgi:hypothetical protein